MPIRESRLLRYRRVRRAVPAARAKARALAREWAIPHIADSLEWGVSELVTNAVTHGRAARGSRVLVAYRLTDECVRVDVRDWAGGTPRPSRSPLSGQGAGAGAGALAERGRGLAVVATLADRWGVVPRVIGKSVWFEIDISAPPKETP